MHPNPAFVEQDSRRLLALARSHPFATVVAVAGDRARVARAPVLVDRGADGAPDLRFHLSRASRAAESIAASERALLLFHGPDAYVSPDWIGDADAVPTWNYLSVEAEGAIERLGADDARRLLDDLSAHFEAQLAPKPPWTRDKMSPGRFEAMLRGILAFRMRPERLEGVTKLSQNKGAETRRGIAEALGEAHPLGDWMREIDR